MPTPLAESEKRVEDFIRPLFEAMDWAWLTKEVTPQKEVKGGSRTTRVDYAFRKSGDLRPSFYVEVKRFSDKLETKDHIKQVLDYGKNSDIRWVVLTNFLKWKVFNSDYFDEPEHSELFEFSLQDCLTNVECLQWLLLFNNKTFYPCAF